MKAQLLESARTGDGFFIDFELISHTWKSCAQSRTCALHRFLATRERWARGRLERNCVPRRRAIELLAKELLCCSPKSYCAARQRAIVLLAKELLCCSPKSYCAARQRAIVLLAKELLCCSPKSYCAARQRAIVLLAKELLCCSPKSYCAARQRAIVLLAKELLCCSPKSYCAARQRAIVLLAKELLCCSPKSYCAARQRVNAYFPKTKQVCVSQQKIGDCARYCKGGWHIFIFFVYLMIVCLAGVKNITSRSQNFLQENICHKRLMIWQIGLGFCCAVVFYTGGIVWYVLSICVLRRTHVYDKDCMK